LKKEKESTVAERCKTNHNYKNKITIQKTQRQFRKHNNNSENTTTIQKTQ